MSCSHRSPGAGISKLWESGVTHKLLLCIGPLAPSMYDAVVTHAPYPFDLHVTRLIGVEPAQLVTAAPGGMTLVARRDFLAYHAAEPVLGPADWAAVDC